jgi:hypothetical protein
MPDFESEPQVNGGDDFENASFGPGGPGRNCWTNPWNGLQDFEGVVCEKIMNAGSKSEHKAVVLQTDSGDYPLRQPGGNPFSDPELQKLVGKRLSLQGTLLSSGTIIIKPGSIQELP